MSDIHSSVYLNAQDIYECDAERLKSMLIVFAQGTGVVVQRTWRPALERTHFPDDIPVNVETGRDDMYKNVVAGRDDSRAT
jgi:hypothetical protein